MIPLAAVSHVRGSWYDGSVKDVSENSNVSNRRPSPLGGRKPTKDDLAAFATDDPNAIDDILPIDSAGLRLLIVGINPGLWTAAVNAPFARPGNRFWPSLFEAGLTDHLSRCLPRTRPGR
jgi:TDG/mug DNA glycosylase family protein